MYMMWLIYIFFILCCKLGDLGSFVIFIWVYKDINKFVNDVI